jgi:FkbM family methyltransferase
MEVTLGVSAPMQAVPPTLKKRNIFRVFYRASIGKVIARAFHDQIPCLGCVIDTTSPLVVPRIKAKLFWRGYEPVEINFVQKYLQPDRDVVDLGSSLGVIAAHVGKKLAAGQRVICVEANPQLADIIRTNVTRNAPHVSLEIVSGAVDYPPDGRPLVELVLGFDNLVAHIVEGEVVPEGIFVPTISLSKILTCYGLADYALVSDIEGSEAGLLEMDSAALANCRQMIIELHHTVRRGRVILLDELATALTKKHGFRLVDRRGSVYVFEK